MVAAQPHLYWDAVDNYCAHVGEFTPFAPYTFTLHKLQVLPMQVNNLSEMECAPCFGEYNGWYAPTTDDWEHFQVPLQLHKSHGHFPLSVAEWLCYGEAAIFTHLLHCSAEVVRASLAEAAKPSSVVPPPSAAPTEERPSLSVASASTDPAASSIASSQDAPIEEFMELDYTDDSLAPTNVHPETTPQVVPSPSDAAIATNTATLAIPEAEPSSSSDMANAVSEC
ncbi:hypothetical protein C0989_003973 [Termitomyces sp. Mn162]|nr:hypothetical protein C0989_003973 [Termitomyces sp. Mn162]